MDIDKIICEVEEDIKDQIAEVDARCMRNSMRVLDAFQKNRIADVHFNSTTGYGYDDIGRDTIEKVFADIFHTEDALVRTQFISGTHAITVALFANLRPGDTLLSISGKPYDTLDSIIGFNDNKSSLKSYGIKYEQIDLVDDDFDIEKLRYHKIIIMTDADVDGAHIATLLLTFLYRFMPELIKQGYVYLATPPLYQIQKNKNIWYAYSDDELNAILTEIGRDGNNKIQRYKGLGEMDADQLWDTTMDPEKRILKRVQYEDDMQSELDLTFTTLMGDQVEPRREFIEANAKFVENLYI